MTESSWTGLLSWGRQSFAEFLDYLWDSFLFLPLKGMLESKGREHTNIVRKTMNLFHVVLKFL